MGSVTLADYNAHTQAIKELQKVSVTAPMTMSRSAGGTVFGINVQPGQSASTSPEAELCEAYSATVQYREGEHVTDGTLVYECAADGTVGLDPTSLTGWTIVVDADENQVAGITCWPTLTYGGAYYTRMRMNWRYNTTTHKLLTYYAVTHYDSSGRVFRVETINEETGATAVWDNDPYVPL